MENEGIKSKKNKKAVVGAIAFLYQNHLYRLGLLCLII
jgi:hypothetical protein